MAAFVPATRFERQPNLEMRFPPLPRTVSEVSKLLAQTDDVPDTHRLADLTATDPIVAVTVLRRINSAYYGMRRRVGDLRKAVFLLGFLEVCNIVLTMGMMKLAEALNSEEQADIFHKIMRAGVGSAAYTQELALRLGLKARNVAFTTGLLHVAGRLVLLYNKPDDYEALWFTSDHGAGPTAEQERAIFGTDSVEISAVAADRWHLPERLERVLAHRLQPHALEDEDLRLLALALGAGIAAAEQFHESDQPGEPTVVDAAPFEALADAAGVPTDEVMDIVLSVRPQTAEFIDAMTGPVG